MFRSLRESLSRSLRNLLRRLRQMFLPDLPLSLRWTRSFDLGSDERCSFQPGFETLFPRRGGANVAPTVYEV